MRRITGEFREKHTPGAKARVDSAGANVGVETPTYLFRAFHRDFVPGAILCV